MNKTEKKTYGAPRLVAVEFKTELGFATSPPLLGLELWNDSETQGLESRTDAGHFGGESTWF